MRHTVMLTALVVAGALLPAKAYAGPITYEFDFTMTSLAPHGPVDELTAAGVVLGALGHGTITWDPDSPAWYGDGASFYNRDSGPTAGYTLSIGGLSVFASLYGSSPVVISGSPAQTYFDFEEVNSTIGSSDTATFSFLHGSLPSTEPFCALDPVFFESGTVRVTGPSYTSSTIDFAGSLSNIRAVPEPATWLLVAIGGAVAFRWRARRVDRAHR